MSGSVRALTSGPPQWSAAKGSFALDGTTTPPTLYVNTDGAYSWLALEGLGQVVQDSDAIAAKLRKLISVLIEMGFDDVTAVFAEDYERYLEEQ